MKNNMTTILFLVLLNAIIACVSYYAYMHFDFAHIDWFYLLALIPLASLLYLFLRKKGDKEILYSSTKNIDELHFSLFHLWKPFLFGLKMVGISFLILALARPQSKEDWQDISTEGIDIVLTLDISESMLAADLKPSRLVSAKKVASAFIESRKNDRIGLVVYGSEGFTQCPLTTDHYVLQNLLTDVEIGLIEGRTAIGLGLATAVNRLRDSKAKSKTIILLTDGVNNTGDIPPLTAGEIAAEYGIRVYTIGVGSKGTAPMPYTDMFGRKKMRNVPVEIDESTLKKIAEMTDGKYFRATSNKALKNIYAEIDQLEKTKIQVTEHSKKNEENLPFIILAFAFLVGQSILKNTIFRSIS